METLPYKTPPSYLENGAWVCNKHYHALSRRRLSLGDINFFDNLILHSGPLRLEPQTALQLTLMANMGLAQNQSLLISWVGRPKVSCSSILYQKGFLWGFAGTTVLKPFPSRGTVGIRPTYELFHVQWVAALQCSDLLLAGLRPSKTGRIFGM